MPSDRLYLSAVTIGEIQAGIEITRETRYGQGEMKLEVWLDLVLAAYNILPVDAARIPRMGGG